VTVIEAESEAVAELDSVTVIEAESEAVAELDSVTVIEAESEAVAELDSVTPAAMSMHRRHNKVRTAASLRGDEKLLLLQRDLAIWAHAVNMFRIHVKKIMLRGFAICFVAESDVYRIYRSLTPSTK
jgi:hypothetical protein